MPSAPLADRVRPGDSFSAAHLFDAADIMEFAKLSFNRNPVHCDPGAGSTSRFGKRIASAEHITSLLLGLAGSWLSDFGTSFSLGCSFRFTAAVREGDRVELRWVVTNTAYKESLKGMIVVLEGTATNESGRVCARGTMEMLLQE